MARSTACFTDSYSSEFRKTSFPVDDDGEPLPDSMSDAEPHAPLGVEAHDLNSNPRTEILQELLRQTMRAFRVLSDEGRRFASFFCLQRLDALIRERLGARRAAGFQDRREQAEQLDSGRPGGHGPEYRRSKVKAFRTGVVCRWRDMEWRRPWAAFGICRTVNVTFKRPAPHTYDSPTHGPG